MDKTSIGDRMKSYEAVASSRLIPKIPVLMRLDGKAFHTLTKNMQRPIDDRFTFCMNQTAKYLCKNISGARIAYIQSDEISILLTDYINTKTEPYFNNKVQKMCSISAAMASAYFTYLLQRKFADDNCITPGIMGLFDCRVWNSPTKEICNYFIWRQMDATRNSISSLAQSHFSHKTLHGVNTNDMQDLLMLEKQINWNDCPVPQKRGRTVIKEEYLTDNTHGQGPDKVKRTRWVTDTNIPIFTQDRNYINKYVETGLYANDV